MSRSVPMVFFDSFLLLTEQPPIPRGTLENADDEVVVHRGHGTRGCFSSVVLATAVRSPSPGGMGRSTPATGTLR